MELSILNVAYPLAPVGPDTVGGAEQIVATLDRALTAAGAQSFVIASEGSKVSGTHIPTPLWNGTIDETTKRQAREYHARVIRETLGSIPVDVVHFHGLDFLDYLEAPGIPTLITLHLPPEWYPSSVFRLARPNTHLNCVSRDQRDRCPHGQLPLRIIPNGVDIEAFWPRSVKRNYALALGRICPEKGFHFALEATAKAGVPFLLGGEVFPYESHKRYFEREIVPRLSPQARFLGSVGFRRKRRLLARACCLLAPSTAPETSSLAAMEALASGTPVIAFASGALREIVDHGRTGFLVNDSSEMAEAISLAGRLNRADCRRAAMQRFSASRMTEDYISTYLEIAGMRERAFPRYVVN